MKMTRAILVSTVGLMLAGCMPKMTIEEMKAEMPGRPAELDQLNKMVGTWTADGTMTSSMLEEGQDELKTSGKVVYKWDKDKRYLVGHHEYEMEHFGPMHGIETITYDPKAKKFRSTWTDSMGSVGVGTMWYDAKKDVWRSKASSHSGWGASKMKGLARYPDEDTMEWEFSEYMMGGMIKTSEMKATMHRQ